jgi:hypothetical protein
MTFDTSAGSQVSDHAISPTGSTEITRNTNAAGGSNGFALVSVVPKYLLANGGAGTRNEDPCRLVAGYSRQPPDSPMREKEAK